MNDLILYITKKTISVSFMMILSSFIYSIYVYGNSEWNEYINDNEHCNVVLVVPPNDDIDSAQLFEVASVCIPENISTADATPSLADGDNDIWFYSLTPLNGNIELELTDFDGSEVPDYQTTIELFKREAGVVEQINLANTHIKRSMLIGYDTIFIRIRNYNNNDSDEDFNLCVNSFEDIPNDNVLTASQISVTDTFVNELIDIVGLSMSMDNSYSTDYWRYAIVPDSGNLDIRISTENFSNNYYDLSLFQIPVDTLFELTPTELFLDSNISLSFRIENLNPGDTTYIRYTPGLYPMYIQDPMLTARSYQLPINETINEALELETDSLCNLYTSSLFYAKDGDLWFYYVPPDNGLVVFDFITPPGNGAQYHDVFAYQMDPNLTLIGSNSEGNTRLKEFQINSGSNIDTVFIQIKEYFHTDEDENFDFCILEVNAAENDFCSDATDLVYNALPGTYFTYIFEIPTISGVPTDVYQCNTNYDDQYDTWYKFVPGQTGDYIIEIATDERIELYEGDCNSLELIKCNSILTESNSRRMQVDTLHQDQEYFLKVLRTSWNGYDSLDIAVYDWVHHPYDGLDDAYEIQLDYDCEFETYTLDFSSHNPSEGNPCAGLGNPYQDDIWLKVKTPASGNLHIEFDFLMTSNASQELAYDIYAKDSNQNLELLYCGQYMDDYTPNEDIFYDFEIYDTLYFAFHSTIEDKQGDFSVCIHDFEIPENDTVTGALYINSALNCSMDTFSTKYATIENFEYEECSFSSSTADADLWFKAITSDDGTIDLSYQRIDFSLFVLEFYQKIDEQYNYLNCISQNSYLANSEQIHYSLNGYPPNDTLYIRFIERDGNVEYGKFGFCVYNNLQTSTTAKIISGPSLICEGNIPIEYFVQGFDSADSIVFEYLDNSVVQIVDSINSFIVDFEMPDTDFVSLNAYGIFTYGIAYTEPFEINILDSLVCEIIFCSDVVNNLVVGDSPNFGINVSDIFHAKDQLSSSVLINNEAYKLFKGGQEVFLDSGFEVALGSEFKATIESCIDN